MLWVIIQIKVQSTDLSWPQSGNSYVFVLDTKGPSANFQLATTEGSVGLLLFSRVARSNFMQFTAIW